MKWALLTLFLVSPFSFALDDVLNLSCVGSAKDPHFKMLHLVTQPSGNMRARVTLASANSPTETYSYMVRRIQGSRCAKGEMAYRAALGRLQLSICSPASESGSFRSSLHLITPKRARIFPPHTHLEFKDLACTLNLAHNL